MNFLRMELRFSFYCCFPLLVCSGALFPVQLWANSASRFLIVLQCFVGHGGFVSSGVQVFASIFALFPSFFFRGIFDDSPGKLCHPVCFSVGGRRTKSGDKIINGTYCLCSGLSVCTPDAETFGNIGIGVA